MRAWSRLVCAGAATLVGLGATGCSNGASPEEGSPPASSTASPAASAKLVQAAENDSAPVDSAAAPKAAEEPEIAIPEGTLSSGSMPGDEGRDPVLEPALVEVPLGAYSIDRYLYPNDPSAVPVTGVTRERAGQLCKERARRLCTELEWEHACKGPEGHPFAGRAKWDPKCAEDPSGCPSGFGVLGMSAHYREWTASDIAPVEKIQAQAAAVRGSARDAAAPDHRCAHRSAVDADTKAEDLAFRCCGGPPNAAQIEAPKWLQTFRRVEMSASEVEELFRSVPQLASLSGAIAFFDEADAKKRVLERGKVEDEPKGLTLATAPLLWNPSPGEEILVLTGKAGEDSFVVAFYKLADGRYRTGSTLILKKDPGPVVLAFDGYVRRRLTWATCWDCAGEWGKITYRKENRVVITQE